MRVAIIPARGGSRRIPRKNIRMFHGKPIIAHSIEAAKRSRLFHAIYVSTDDDEIANIASRHGVYRLTREPEDARDEVGTQEVMRRALIALACGSAEQYGGIEAACCIYPTAPLMDATDLIRGSELMLNYAAAYAFSVGTEPLHDAGQFYWGRPAAFVGGTPLIAQDTIMVPIDTNRVCDINTEEDWGRAEEMYARLTASSRGPR
jgi:pseudaminic acid cytidylyltransferase